MDLAQVVAVFGLVAQRADRGTKGAVDAESFEKAFASLAMAPSAEKLKSGEVALDTGAFLAVNDIAPTAIPPSAHFALPMAPVSKEMIFRETAPDVEIDIIGNEVSMTSEMSQSQNAYSPQNPFEKGRVELGSPVKPIDLKGEPEKILELPITIESARFAAKDPIEGQPTGANTVLTDSAAPVAQATVSVSLAKFAATSENSGSLQIRNFVHGSEHPAQPKTSGNNFHAANAQGDSQRSIVPKSAPEMTAQAGQNPTDQDQVSEKVVRTTSFTEIKAEPAAVLAVGQAAKDAKIEEMPRPMGSPKPDPAIPFSTSGNSSSDKIHGLTESNTLENRPQNYTMPLRTAPTAPEITRPVIETEPSVGQQSTAPKAPEPVVDAFEAPGRDQKPAPVSPQIISRPREDVAVAVEKPSAPVAAPEKSPLPVNSQVPTVPVPQTPMQTRFENTGTPPAELQAAPGPRSVVETGKGIYDVRVTKEDAGNNVAAPMRSAEPPFAVAVAQVDIASHRSARDLTLESEALALSQTNSASLSPKAMEAVAKAPPAIVPGDVVKLSEQLRAGARMDRFPVEIALDPPELGQVRMMLQTNESGTTLVIMADRPETADLMRRHAAFLHDAFAQEGRGELNLQFGSHANQGESGEKRALGGASGEGRNTDGRALADADVPVSERSITERHRQIGQMSKTLNLTL